MSPKTRNIIIILTALILVGLVAFWWINRGSSNIEPQSAADAGQEDEREQSQSIDTPATTEDTGGQDVDENASGISSDSGNITLITPSQGSLVETGKTISGTANTSAVIYEIAESGRGLIARGELNVVDGKFSGVISSLSPSSTEGTFRVFSVDPNTLRESDHINIPIILAP